VRDDRGDVRTRTKSLAALPDIEETPGSQPHVVWRDTLITLGIILLIIGLLVTSIHFLIIIGPILLVVGLVLALLGALGRAVGGRRHYY
jgi:Family of unknown function (DUF6131)